MFKKLYPDLNGFRDLEIEYDQLGRKINNYIQYVNHHGEHESTQHPAPSN